jgi:hypothetical protein
LQLSVGGVVSLRSPLPGFLVDVMNGPVPLFANVTEMMGTRTWLVQYGITTYINDCIAYTTDAPVILSHTFEMSDTLDQDYFCSRQTKGTCIFRADSLAALGTKPDDFRSLFVPPIPVGFKREHIRVAVEKQPNVINYETIDRELPIGWSAAGVSRVKAFHTVGYQRGDKERAALKAISGVVINGLQKLGDIVSREKADLTLGVESGLAVAGGAVIDLAATALGAGVSFGQDTMPTTFHDIVVEVWGDATSTRRSLEQFALAVVQRRLATIVNSLNAIVNEDGSIIQQAIKNLPPAVSNALSAALGAIGGFLDTNVIAGALPTQIAGKVDFGPLPAVIQKLVNTILPGIDTTTTHELTGKYVKVHHVVQMGPIASILTGMQFQNQAGNGFSTDVIFPPNDDTGDLLVMNGNPIGPMQDGISRGSLFATLIGTALKAPCGQPGFWGQTRVLQTAGASFKSRIIQAQLHTEEEEGLDESDPPVEVPPASVEPVPQIPDPFIPPVVPGLEAGITELGS